MKPRNGRLLAADEADGSIVLVAPCRQTRPQLPRSRPVMDADSVEALAFEGEDHILILHLLRPAELDEIFGAPCLDEAPQSQQALVICASEIAKVTLLKS